MMKSSVIFDQGNSREDRYLVQKPLFAVFDGVSSVMPYQADDGRTGGMIAAEIARDTFAEDNAALVELARRTNKRIQEAMSHAGVDTSSKLNRWGTTAAVVRIGEKTFDWLQIADSVLIVLYRDATYKLLVPDVVIQGEVEVLKKWKQFADKSVSDIRPLIADDARALREQTNKTFGALNGEEEAMSFLRTGTESLENVSDILLFTDGLMLPKTDPVHADDWDHFVALYREGGLSHVQDYVRTIEKEDPLCWNYPRFKQHDDIAAISIAW